MSRVISKFPEAKLVVAGKGPDLERLKQKSHELKLSDNVIFTGFVSELTLEALYKRCKAFVMPSTKEGFGLVYLEAMKHKKPCVALKDSSAQEIIKDKESGLLIENQSPQHIAQAIISLLQDDAWTIQLGENGYDLYQKQFTWDLFTKRLSLYLDDLLTT
jgi:glycosyltransferase involved in cell wall biosynthesis